MHSLPSPSRPMCASRTAACTSRRWAGRVSVPLHRYADCKPLTARVRQKAEGKQPQGYACIVFEVPSDHPDACPPAVSVGTLPTDTGHRGTARSIPSLVGLAAGQRDSRDS